MRKGYPVRVDVVHGGQQPLAAGARPPRRGGQALYMIFLFQLSPKWGMNPRYETNHNPPPPCQFTASDMPPCSPSTTFFRRGGQWVSACSPISTPIYRRPIL